MEQELFGQVLDEDELSDELDALDAMMVEKELPSAPVERIGEEQAQKHRKENGIENNVENNVDNDAEEEPREKVAQMA